MRGIRTIGYAALVLLAALGGARSAHGAAELRELELTPEDRVLILAPHPDDEVIGCGGIMQRARALGARVRVVFLTYGDSNERAFSNYRKHPVLAPAAVRAMGLVRRQESMDADRALGVEHRDLTFLGYPDFGTLSIWCRHWGDEPAYHSLLTRVSQVPYTNAFRLNAPYKGEQILQDLKSVMAEFRPTRVFVSHPADHNPDHQALYLLTRVALWDLEPDRQPQLLPYLVHYRHWTRTSPVEAGAPLAPPSELQGQPWTELTLRSAEFRAKRAAVRIFRTQFGYSGPFLLSFVRPNELFGDLPLLTAGRALQGEGLQIERPEDAATAEQRMEPDPDAREEYIGVQGRALRLTPDALEVALSLSRPLTEFTAASVFAFGYRRDTPFQELPKIHVSVHRFSHRVHDQSRSLPSDSVSVSRTGRELLVRVPLALLGRPQYLLTSARTSSAEITLDWTAWRALRTGADPGEGSHAESGGTNTTLRAP